MTNNQEKISEYAGGCLCRRTTFTARGEPINPHLCSCTMCQKSSGAPTVAWVEFPLATFQWTSDNKPSVYQSSEKTKRCFCQTCGCLVGTLNKSYPNVCITIASLDNPDLVIPSEQHSYKEEAPCWWKVNILEK